MTSIEDGNDNGPIHNYSLCDASRIKATLKPLFASMRILGIVYGDVFQACRLKPNSVQPSEDFDYDAKQETVNGSQGKRWWHYLGLCFSIIVGVLNFGVFFHQVYEAAMSHTLMDVMTRVFMLLWVVLCLLQHVICVFVTSHRTKKNPLNRFDKLVKAILSVRAASVARARNSVRYTVIMGWICYILNITVVISGSHYPDYETRNSIRAVFNGKSNLTVAHNDAITYAYAIVLPFMCGSWTIPTCFYIALCLLVAGLFNDLFERASNAIMEKKSINLQDLRQEYVRLCNVLSALNDLLSPLGMSMFAVYIPLICLNINVCIQTFDRDSVINRVAYIFWISGNVFILLVVSICGAQVNNSVGRRQEYHTIHLRDQSNLLTNQLNN